MPSPIAAATLQAAALATASNLCAQLLDAHRNQDAPGGSSLLPFAKHPPPPSPGLDLRQLARFVALALLTTPPNYLWQQQLERVFPARPPPPPPRDIELRAVAADDDDDVPRRPPPLSVRNTLAKWFVDCIVLGALANTLAFLLLMGLLKGQPAPLIWRNVRTETVPIIVAGYKIWPVASIVSFVFVPVHRRIVFLSFVGLLWGIYLSLVAARV
ncbi:hypothetical protein CDD83_4773 [Cordyceps sp. RAO-2017]|nr:hypothetical protein CDD83_4773 [Cordyceps sp. RAO-2017]